ncbi:protein kinase [Nostoc calcicola FACHB-389]|nr:serine/threonine protein kinase [Nostoc calcicola FACHB-3891]OKH29797.1 protein kinase [Nostoc calcicola FACHB-389]
MAWNPGQQLFGDRYIIERKLGEGGIGITYLAKNQRGELRVIKTLREQILNHPDWIPHQDKLRHDFRDEALRLALCRHPHIMQVENAFDEGNFPCMVMEYIEGEDLGKLITEKGALPEAEALLYIRQIGEALTLVHEKGLLHRDLKPGNIMMRAGKPEAVLIDFGIARQFIPGGVQQHTQNLTPGYAPPEQYLPDAERGEYIDVYALAATLYSLLTGELPMAVPVRLQNFTMRSPKELNSSVSDQVNEAIMKGMALNYKFRPQSVQEWLDLLGEEIVAPTQPVPTQSVKFSTHIPPSWQCAHIIPGGYSNNWVNSLAFSNDGQILASGGGNGVIKLWSVATGREIRTLSDHSNWVNSLDFSSDGQILASCSRDRTIKLWSVTTGREIHTFTSHSDEVTFVAFSSDGRILASVSGNKNIELWEVKLWEVATGSEIRTLARGSDPVYSIAFSSDGQMLAIGGKSVIKLWSLATGSEIYRLADEPYGDFKSVVFIHNGAGLASAGDMTIKLWEVTTGREIRTLFVPFLEWVTCIAFSSDGQILARGSRDKTIKLWEVATGTEICTFNLFDSVFSVAFSSDGGWLAAGDGSGNIKIWRSQLVVE